ncbi:MAG: phosphoribosyltransferase family protein [Chloroherpetonaceae bacterium]|nr:phosphoribosyltransferase family protein [Chloroherpetonaceae bacterium]
MSSQSNPKRFRINSSRHLSSNFLSILCPRLCIVCERILPTDVNALYKNYLCQYCFQDLDRMDLPGESRKRVFDRAKKHFVGLVPFDDAFVGFQFHKQGKLQRVIHAFKYEGISGVAEAMGEVLAEMFIRERMEDEQPVPYDSVVALPLHRLRQIERGYNQAESIAVGVARRFGLEVNELLYRTRYTETQTGFDAADRKRNMTDVFRIRSSQLAHKRVILVDDVLTTGSTLVSAAETLKKGGVEKVMIMTLALAAE